MLKNPQLEEAFSDYVQLGIDPDETMMLSQNEWAKSHGMETDEVFAYNELDIGECQFHLYDTISRMDTLITDIKLMQKMSKNVKDYGVREDLKIDEQRLLLTLQELTNRYHYYYTLLQEMRSKTSSLMAR